MRLWIAGALGLVLSLGAALAQEPAPEGAEFRVNSYTTDYQANPEVGMGDDGGFVVVWDSKDGQDGDLTGVFGQRYTRDGVPIGSEFQANTHTTGRQNRSSVAVAPSGNFVVSWDSTDGQDGDFYGVIARRYDSDGVALGGEFVVNTYSTNRQLSNRVSIAPDGSFMVVWNSFGQDGDDFGVFGQSFDTAGNPAGSEFQVNTFTPSFQGVGTVASDANGGFLVAWHSRADQDGDLFGIFAQRFGANGSPIGSEFQVNTYTTGDQKSPAATFAPTGEFVIVWNSRLSFPTSYEVRGRLFDANGQALGDEFQVNTYTDGFQRVGSIAQGSFVVVYESYGPDGDSGGILGQRFSDSGDRLGSEFQINTYTTLTQRDPVIATAPNGEMIVVWEDGSSSSDGQDGSSWGVFAQRFVIPTFADGFESGDTSAWSSTVP